MARFRIAIGAQAERDLLSIPFPMRRSINQRIRRLQDEPRPTGWEQVGTEGEACLVLYGYELLYTIDEAGATVTIVAILPLPAS